MAITGVPRPPQVHRFPQFKYVDTVRWLPPLSAFDRYAVVALFDSDSHTPSIEIHSLNLNHSPDLTLHSSWTAPSRISSLKTSSSLHKPLIVASTFSGSLHFLFASGVDAWLESEVSVPEKELHVAPVSCVDLVDGGVDCVSVGEDGRVNLVTFGEGRLNSKRVFDSNGLVSYNAVKWASPSEFATGGYGFGLQWWDQRQPDGPVSHFKGDWPHRKTSGIIHSLDIHPSRKHTCVAGGSFGTIFAWDLRWHQQPIVLSGGELGETVITSESDVWEVQYDWHTKSSNVGSVSSSRVLPVMFCSEDGILDVLEQGAEPVELLSEPCAINCLDIDRQNPSDVICGLEWESIAILSRSRSQVLSFER